MTKPKIQSSSKFLTFYTKCNFLALLARKIFTVILSVTDMEN